MWPIWRGKWRGLVLQRVEPRCREGERGEEENMYEWDHTRPRVKTDSINATDNWKRRREKEGEGEKKEKKGIILTHQKPPTIYSTKSQVQAHTHNTYSKSSKWFINKWWEWRTSSSTNWRVLLTNSLRCLTTPSRLATTKPILISTESKSFCFTRDEERVMARQGGLERRTAEREGGSERGGS